ncbi:sensor histidine kinase [Desulfatitalea alkaliphila]|uniref:histidine kinase n=1 Tax=Desulfatitalea alkaliphila TaxID=2929485 RepID=A0AA41R638_9BACT|nr:ATP-binding protein [Desulfatitalea alkaliphila]MCJ8501815.1 ATP-binding protein [Desulfatitalea alkaliphila]
MAPALPLRTRIFLIIGALVVINVIGASVMIWHTYRTQSVLSTIIEGNLTGYRSAANLEVALVNQKGFVTYFFQDGNHEWLRQLGEHRQIFRTRLEEAYHRAEDVHQQRILDHIEKEYERYTTLKDQVIAHYLAERRDQGLRLHPAVREHFFALMNTCEQYKALHAARIQEAQKTGIEQAVRLRLIAAAALTGGLLLAVLLSIILLRQVLGPVNHLLQITSRGDQAGGGGGNAVSALSMKVEGLLADVDKTHLELARSRESLLQAEKLAIVGKLAAGMAHSIRNPFTSVKMRLFSLNRSLVLDSEQKEDFDVITEEIRHIDTIVQNFLEFSRPPKLVMQPISPSQVVDMAVQLLRHRLKSYDVNVTIQRTQPLPEVSADPEQLKEVLVNLIINACEAMENGGRIDIQEAVDADDPAGPMALLHVRDDGPGIPERLREKVFQPFFTTKEEGTGLGLSIVARIVHEHGGRIQIDPAKGMGTTFIIALPIKE